MKSENTFIIKKRLRNYNNTYKNSIDLKQYEIFLKRFIKNIKFDYSNIMKISCKKQIIYNIPRVKIFGAK